MKNIGTGYKILGLVLIVLGCILFVGVLAPLLVRALLGFLALYVINYGMKLRGMPPLTLFLQSWWFSRNFR